MSRPYLMRLSWFCFIATAALGQPVEITPDHSDGVYKAGDTVSWHIEAADSLTSLRYTLLRGEMVDAGHGTLHTGVSDVRYVFDRPGSVLLEVRWGSDDNWHSRVVGGALCAPGSLELSADKPVGFESFWKSKVAELQQIPENVMISKEESGMDNVDYWKITMDNINHSTIQGQLARPGSGDRFPALLIVQWAGVYGLNKDWVTNRAHDGWLTLNIEAHDIPIDKPEQYYRDQAQGPLRNYWAIGNDERNASYFLRMYLSCYRAAQYLSGRPDWNGETLVVMGDSQGGQQTLMTAGFHPAVTAAIALVPAGFDMLGPEVGRKGGWPQWYNWAEGKDTTKVHETSRYFDVANFVSSIHCPILVGVGLLDETCPPEGILAALNHVNAPKKVMILPMSGHQDRNGSQQAFRDERENVWLPALKEGKNPMQ